MKKTMILISVLLLLINNLGISESTLPNTPDDYDAAYTTWNNRFHVEQEKYGYGMALFFDCLLHPSSISPPKLLNFVDLSDNVKKHCALTFEEYTYEVKKYHGIVISVVFESSSNSPNLDWAKTLMFSFITSFKYIESIAESFTTSVNLSPTATVFSHVPNKLLWLNYTITKQKDLYEHKIDLISPI